MSSSMARRVGAAASGGLLAVALLAGCSDSGGSDDTTSEESESPSASESTTATSESLPVPAGVTLTEPGAELGLGDPATVAWRPRQDRVVALDITVDRLDMTSFAESFDGWVVTPEMKGMTPYFVHAKATNVSDRDAGGQLVPLYALADATSMYEALSFQDKTFEPCPGGLLPKPLKPGRSADLCFVYLLPEGVELEAAAFDVDGEQQPITWTGPVTEIEKPKDKKDKKDKGKNGKKDKKKGEQAG